MDSSHTALEKPWLSPFHCVGWRKRCGNGYTPAPEPNRGWLASRCGAGMWWLLPLCVLLPHRMPEPPSCVFFPFSPGKNIVLERGQESTKEGGCPTPRSWGSQEHRWILHDMAKQKQLWKQQIEPEFLWVTRRFVLNGNFGSLTSALAFPSQTCHCRELLQQAGVRQPQLHFKTVACSSVCEEPCATYVCHMLPGNRLHRFLQRTGCELEEHTIPKLGGLNISSLTHPCVSKV